MNAPDQELQSLRSAAQGTDPAAWLALAMALVARQSMEEALDWHLRAAGAGHPHAQVEAARMLLHGIGTAADVRAATDWLLRAESQGHPVAAYLLATVALGGVALDAGTRVNERLFAAIQADFAPALRAAAIHFGRKAHPADQATCMQLLERAANRGDAAAAALLAERLAGGEGCEPQPDTAEAMWEQLALHGGIARIPRFVASPRRVDAAPNRLAFEDDLQPVAGERVCGRPRVTRVDNLLSADECRLLMLSAAPMLRPSTTADPATGEIVANALRTSADASFDPLVEDFALRMIQLRMAHAARCPLVDAEQLIVLRYRPGEEYRPHRDYLPASTIAGDHPEAGNRARTICVYLNEVEAGGQTEFPVAGVRVQPQAGRAVIFDNLREDGSPDVDSLHAGAPVERGEKWLATLWIRQGPYRGF